MNLSRFVTSAAGAGIAACAALVACAPSASAQATQTFAQYFQQDTTQQTFTLTNNGASSTITGTAQIFFIYGVPNTFGATPTLATLNFSAGGANLPTTSGGLATERFNTYSFSITANSNGGNLLSGTGNNLDLTGGVGQNASTLQVSTPPSGDVVFTSDYVSFDTSTARNFSIAMSSVTPAIAFDPNGYLRGFDAATSGTFAKNAVVPNAVPEPGLVSFALTGGAGMVGMVLRGRRRAKKA